MKFLILIPVGFALGGCMQTLTGSIAGGESKVFQRPEYVVLGKTSYDQNWIDNQVEGGVAAFGWKRPLPRPASLDAHVTTKQVTKISLAKKTSFIKRIKAKLHFVRPAPVPFTNAVMPPLPEPAPPVVVVAPAPRSPIDQLLHPN